MSDNRLRSIWSIFRNTGCPVALISRDTLSEWVRPGFPLHPAFPHLSSTHKADYLRCYLMHHYGGGYTDIKPTTKKWGCFFDQLENSDKLALGYAELPNGTAKVGGELEVILQKSHAQLIGLCAFIFRKNTTLTAEWLAQTESLLDTKLPLLKEYPASHPLDQTGLKQPDGEASKYPLRWTEMLGDIFHPLIYRHRDHLLQAPIEPIFGGYR